jgi:hypothetical protein
MGYALSGEVYICPDNLMSTKHALHDDPFDNFSTELIRRLAYIELITVKNKKAPPNE